MISDVLSDACCEIETYLNEEPDYVYAEEIRRVCFVMQMMRQLLDTSPSTPPDFIAAREKGLRQLVAAVPDDIVDAAERIWDPLDNYKEVIEALEDTNESVINHRQNDILRILTVFSVILLPLTLISGIFGMNVHFPGFDTAWAFWTIFGVMVAAAVGMLSFFRYKRWL